MVTCIAFILSLLHLLGILSALEVLLYARSPQGAVAWCLFLIFFPILGLPVYWSFGRTKFHGYRERMQRVVEHRKSGISWYFAQIEQHVSHPEDAEAGRAETFARIAGESFLSGNSVELLIDGNETFRAIFEAIDQARCYVFVEFFIIKDDEIGREFKERLIAAAQRGVKIFLVYDEVGSHDLPRQYLAQLRDAGIQVSSFGTRKGIRNFFQINFRNHRKIVVVDGQVGFIGGHNVGDEYLGREPRFGRWRDTHLKVSGPAVLQFKATFFSDWVWATGTAPDVDLKAPAVVGDVSVLTIPFGPADAIDRGLLYFTHCISSARSRVWIASPYFVPDDALLGALQLAALRGVDVRIILPAKRDHMLVWLASFFYVPEAASHGVKVYRYQDGFLHEKVAVIDDSYACVGSANFDNRSCRLNFEASSVIADKRFTAQVASMLEEDMRLSEDVSHQRVQDLSLLRRLLSRFARIFSPIL